MARGLHVRTAYQDDMTLEAHKPRRGQPVEMKSAKTCGKQPKHSVPASTVTICSLLLTLVLVSLPASARGEAATGLVAAYSFDEGGGVSVADRSGSGNAGIV